MSSASTDPTRLRLADHLLGPVADLLDLGADAAAALATATATAFTADPHVPDRVAGRRPGAGRAHTAGNPAREPSR